MTNINLDRRKFLTFAAGIVTVGAGGAIIANGFDATPDNIPPDIDKPLIAKPNQPKSGVEVIKTEKKVITLDNMGANMLLIPPLNVYAKINTTKNFGRVNANGLIIPSEDEVTRWVKGSNVADNKGNILLAGHVSFNGSPGALYNLAKLKVGEVAMVSDGNNHRQQFQLDSMISYKKQSLPAEVWSPKGDKKLIIVTCGGKLHKLSNGTWHFDSNIVSTWHPISKVL